MLPKNTKFLIYFMATKSIHNRFSYLILFYHPKKLFYQLYHTILQYTQYPNFYFPILLIKIIFLHNKIHFIIKIIFSYSTLSLKYIFFGWHSATMRSHIWDRIVALWQKNLVGLGIAIQLLEQFGPKCQMKFTIWHLRSPLLML